MSNSASIDEARKRVVEEELMARRAEPAPAPEPEDKQSELDRLYERMAHAKLQEASLQSMENLQAARAGAPAASYRGMLTAGPQAELESHIGLKEREAKHEDAVELAKERAKLTEDSKNKAKKTDYVVRGTNTPVIFEDGIYKFQDPDTGELRAIPKSGVMKIKAGGSGVPGAGRGGKKPRKLKELSPKELEGISDLESMETELIDLQNMVNNLGDLENLDTGFYTSSLRDFSTKFVPGYEPPEAYTKLKTTAQGIFNIMAKIRSGAAVTGPEMERLEKEMPTMDDKPGPFKVKLGKFLARVQKNKALILKNLKRAGRNVSEFSPQVTTSQPASKTAPAKETTPAPPPEMTEEDKQALKFTKDNPNDPKTPKFLKHLEKTYGI